MHGWADVNMNMYLRRLSQLSLCSRGDWATTLFEALPSPPTRQY